MSELPDDFSGPHWDYSEEPYVGPGGVVVQVTRYFHRVTEKHFYFGGGDNGRTPLFDRSDSRDGSVLSPGGAVTYRRLR